MEGNSFEKIKIRHLNERKDHIAKELNLRVAMLKEHRTELKFLLENNASSFERNLLLIKHKSDILELRAINQDQWILLLNSQKEELRSLSNFESNN